VAIDETPVDWTSLVLLENFRAGDSTAADELFCRYFERLAALARSRLSPRVARRVDAEDVVQSVYRSFFIRARAGGFTLSRGGDLWRLLSAITKHKLLREARHQSAGRRSVEAERRLDHAEAAQLSSPQDEPSVEDAVALADELEWIFSRLDGTGRRALELRFQGAPLAEIAAETGRSERTVRRTLSQVRKLLAERFDCERTRGGVAELAAGPERSRRQKPPVDQLLRGPLLSHREFQLKRMIGAGRMGKVYEAWHQTADRAVAVKFLRKSLLKEPLAVQRFISEARTISKLTHPNIVGIHGLGRAPAGAYFIVMDLVEGGNLARSSGPSLPRVEEVARWAMQMCDALEHAHSRGIIHCDLKPANILLDGARNIRVTDFGLARSLREYTPWTAEVEGTAPFMAPEQASRRWGPIGVRTDLYGLGAVLFALLTGRPPWIGQSVLEILSDVISEAPVVAPEVFRPDLPEPLCDLCRKCLAKRPEERFATASDVRTRLARLIGSL
jgi:RNA polymerase sigma factor (sigma-70 family)